MADAYAILLSALRGECDYSTAAARIHSLVKSIRDKSKYLPVYRAIISLRDGKLIDFCGHLRQCLCYFPGNIIVSKNIGTILAENRTDYNFVFPSNDSEIIVNIDRDILKGDPDLASSYTFSERRVSSGSIGDGVLFRNFGYTRYLSIKQKLLMYLIANQVPNETILACLPTGGGKSLSWELPALSGQLQGKMAIVVVPTVALAMDHQMTSAAAVSDPFSDVGMPAAYYGSLSDNEKSNLIRDMKDGRISILYISPEALLQERFKSAVLEVAQRGMVGMLVVDEAHLIVQWGIRFRPEFQLLSSFRDQLSQISPDGIRTLLLSATLTDEDTDVIKTVFSSQLFTEFRGDELRPEPSFYIKRCNTPKQRLKTIRRLVDLTPRPLILYAATPAQAEDYYLMLWDRGYRNLGIFTGDTEGEKREELVRRWRENEIDLMVATSAFGMGVDKADVRTIITAYIPESISRFYQEVGRAGRDGYASLSYWLTVDSEDRTIVHDLTKSTVMTTDTIVERWSSLLRESSRENPDEIWIDINTSPDYLKQEFTGKRNQGWNKDTVLFLLRSGLLRILESSTSSVDDYRILVKLLNIPLLENPTELKTYLSEYRARERERVNEGIESVFSMIENTEDNCYSDFLVCAFPYSEAKCFGCPSCRKHNLPPYNTVSNPVISTTKARFHDFLNSESDSYFSFWLHQRQELMVVTSEKSNDTTICDQIAYLIRNDVNIVVYPPSVDPRNLVERLSQVEAFGYLLLTIEELRGIPIKWISGICALFYTGDDNYDRELYAFSEKYLLKHPENKVIHLAPKSQQIASRHKLLTELVDNTLTESLMV